MVLESKRVRRFRLFSTFSKEIFIRIIKIALKTLFNRINYLKN